MSRGVIAGLTFLNIIAGTAVLEAADVKVTPVEISEQRVAALVPRPPGAVPGLHLTFRVGGADVAKPAQCGRWNITEAKDDTGASLLPVNQFALKNLNQVSEWMIDKKDGSFTINIDLASPLRKATKIAALKGEFVVLAGGEKKDVTVPAVKAITGKPVESPDLKAAGVEVKVVPQQGPSFAGAQMVTFDVTGNVDALQKIRLVGKNGTDLPGNPSWNTDPKTHVLHYVYFTPKVDDDTAAVISAVVGQKTVTVPVDCKDLPLP